MLQPMEEMTLPPKRQAVVDRLRPDSNLKAPMLSVLPPSSLPKKCRATIVPARTSLSLLNTTLSIANFKPDSNLKAPMLSVLPPSSLPKKCRATIVPARTSLSLLNTTLSIANFKRRIETYRRRQTECVPRFDQSFTGACEQQNLETSALQKRFLEGKAKRQAKKTERKPDLPAISSNLHSSVHVSCQQKFGCGEYEPPAKLQCVGGNTANGAGEGLTKFSVEIVQQLEFTTSAADSQPQQISTNVTVKALANAVKTSGSPPPPQPPRVPSPLDCEHECKAECKSEVADDEFVGLDECAAALERDAASAFPGLADLIGEDDGDDAFEDLITEISEYPEFMKDFDLDGGKAALGAEPPEGEPAPRPYGAGEMSPAAQTLKHMAEQHQQAAGGDWRFRGYGGYRPRPAPPASHADQLHMSQQQQLHLSQPHHNLQVSAAQHMQVSGSGGGHVTAAAQQGMYANFQHQGTPSPQHHQAGSGCDSYSVSQSQSMNFMSSMRSRPAAPTQQQPAGPGNSPQQPLGIAAVGISREQQAKMLQQQQQQMLRAQQQQMRPPPPEYKARFVGARPRTAAPAAPRAFAPHARHYPPEWRHVLIQQQQRHQFPHHHQGFNMGNMGNMGNVSSNMSQQQAQLQQVRLQQHIMQQQQQRASNRDSSMSHLIMQQNQMMSVQGQMSNIHMNQSQTMSMQGLGMSNSHNMQNGMQSQSMHAGSMQPSMISSAPMQSQNSFPSLQSSFSGQTADFNLDFLDNMPSSDASNVTAQELLNSLDNSFLLNDIL